MAEPIIRASDVRLTYKMSDQHAARMEGRRVAGVTGSRYEALKGVSFEVYPGEIFGIIGRNGSGKSTLLRLIAGLMRPDSGTMNTGGRKVSLLSLGQGYLPDLSGLDNLYLIGLQYGFNRRKIDRVRDEIILFSELGDFIYKPVRTYSSGMKSRLSFSISAFLTTDIMLLDEIFSTGDRAFQQKSGEKMRDLIQDERHTVVMVSHSLTRMESMCNRILWLDGGEVKMIGTPSEVIKNYIGVRRETPFARKSPSLLSALREKDGIAVRWRPLSGATGYLVYRALSMNGKYERIGVVQGEQSSFFLDRSAQPNTPYRYTVRAYRAKNGVNERSGYFRRGMVAVM